VKDSVLCRGQENEGLYVLYVGKSLIISPFSPAFTNVCDCSITVFLAAICISHVCELVQRIVYGSRDLPYF